MMLSSERLSVKNLLPRVIITSRDSFYRRGDENAQKVRGCIIAYNI